LRAAADYNAKAADRDNRAASRDYLTVAALSKRFRCKKLQQRR